ncbi:MAG TPA: class I SAM-dependent methyltransferase [Candidatus Binatus sp.]|nr:class I SAM-dependent methyltransferase [Candidatus Binatus sp.]
MIRFSRTHRGFYGAFLAIAIFAGVAHGHAAQDGFEPRVGQAGKDVVWVPTPQSLVDMMLDMAKATPSDFVMDLGSGDGRTVITAAKRGIRAHGIEYNPDMVELSKRNAAKEAVSDKATFAKADLFESDFSQATVITMFLLPEINLKLRPRLLNLKPGTRIVSNTFTMGEWGPDQSASVDQDCFSWCTALLWIVPAKVEGNWKLADGDLTLKQSYQMLTGTLKNSSGTTQLTGRLRGDQIVLTGGGKEYSGRISADAISGSIAGGGNWSAARAKP